MIVLLYTNEMNEDNARGREHFVMPTHLRLWAPRNHAANFAQDHPCRELRDRAVRGAHARCGGCGWRLGK